jgi:hypothetical protein
LGLGSRTRRGELPLSTLAEQIRAHRLRRPAPHGSRSRARELASSGPAEWADKALLGDSRDKDAVLEEPAGR